MFNIFLKNKYKNLCMEITVLLSVLNGEKWLESLQKSLRKDLDIPKLKIGYNKIFGYYIEVTKSHQDKIPNSFIRKQTLTNSERYIIEDLKVHEEKILNAEQNIYNIESKILYSKGPLLIGLSWGLSLTSAKSNQ